VQQADPPAVVDPERVEVGLHPSDLGAAFAKHRVELGQPRAQAVQVVVPRVRADKNAHVK
jgi:hypothetical protein